MHPFSVTATRHPFGMGPRFQACVKEGASIAEIVDLVPERVLLGIPREQLVVCVGTQVVPVPLWKVARPKVIDGQSLPVHIRAPVYGGGDGAGKSILAAVASIAILAVAAFAAPVIAGLAGFTAGSKGAAIISSAVLAAGSSAAALAASALSPPPAAQARAATPVDETASSDAAELGAAYSSQNTLLPGGPIPVCVGRRKIFPPAICDALVEIDGNNEVIETVYALQGPHDLSEIKVGNTPIADIPGVEYQTREGWDSDADLTLVRRYSKTLTARTELVKHVIDPDNPIRLSGDNDPDNLVPQWQTYVTSKSPDEIWIALSWPNGLFDTETPTLEVAVPVRLRLREKGQSTWKNLPEIHFVAKAYEPFRKQIKIIWDDAIQGLPTPPTKAGPYVAFKQSIGQNGTTAAPITDDFVADAHFDDGLADIDSVANVALYQDQIVFYLSDSAFPRGAQYEVSVIRGAVYDKSNFVTDTYAYSGTVLDFFAYDLVAGGSANLPRAQDTVSVDLNVLRVSSIYNDLPVQQKGFALLAIKGRNVTVQDVSIEAARYVKDWDGTGWNTWTVTTNPAPHFRDVLTGALTHPRARIPESELGETSLLSWREFCTDNDHEVAAIVDGRSMNDVLAAICSSAMARPRRWDTVDVLVDRNRTSEPAVQVFTPINSANYSFDKPFPDAPDGYRVTFTNRNNDWTDEQLEVYHPDVAPENAILIEAIRYDSIVTEEKSQERALFDLQQIRRRNAIHSVDVDAEYLVCKRGDVVGLANDILIEQSDWKRIKSVTRNGSSEITEIEFNGDVEFFDETDIWNAVDIWAIDDIWSAGKETYGIVRQNSGGTGSLGKLTGQGGVDVTNIGVLAVPRVKAAIGPGDLVVFGPGEEQFKRMIVADITTGEDLTATINMVDEATDILPSEVIKLSGSGSFNFGGVETDDPPLLSAASFNFASESQDDILWDNDKGWDNGRGWGP